MSCHDLNTVVEIPEGSKKIVLVGNPNVGKSVFFNALTGMYVDVSNFPGTTVDISHGMYKGDVVIDTPGVYGVSSFNDEERVARDVILEADIILNVVDAVHLERDLFLTQQMIDMGKHIIVALNMMDDVKRNGLGIDVDRLSKELGVKVIATVATQGEGMEKIKEALCCATPGNPIEIVKKYMPLIEHKVAIKAEALLVLEEDENIISRNNITFDEQLRETIYMERRRRVDSIITQVVSESTQGVSFATKLGRWMVRPLTGIPILCFTLYVMYQLIGVLVAQTVVDFTEGLIMGTYYNNFIMNLFSGLVQEGTFIGDLLIGEFGLFTMTPIYLIGLLLPLVIAFYLFLSTLEDSGYLPRIATLVDRMLMFLGLNGRAVIPMILGFGCVTMATITTRILGSKRERFIATMLLGLAIPCSAQLGVIAGLVAPLGMKYIMIYVLTIFAVFVIVGTLLNKVMPGKSTDLLIDLPPLRLPQISNVLRKTYTKSVAFIMEAAPLFALGAALITVMQYTGVLDGVIGFFTPLTEGFLKLDPRVATAFIMGIVRRDFGAAGLSSLASAGLLSPPQIIVALVAITLFVPCIAAIMVVFKERSMKESLAIWIGSFVISFLTAGILAQIII